MVLSMRVAVVDVGSNTGLREGVVLARLAERAAA
jgi:hypothetical protein